MRMRSLKMRASTSAGPDAGNGTTIVIGRVGKACADAFRVTCKMSAADEIEKLDRLKKSGSITDQEFARLRAKLVS